MHQLPLKLMPLGPDYDAHLSYILGQQLAITFTNHTKSSQSAVECKKQSCYLFGEDWTEGHFIHHSLKVVGDYGQVAPQLLTRGLYHLRNTLRLLATHLLLPSTLQVWNHYQLPLTHTEPVLLWFRFHLPLLATHRPQPSSKPDQVHWQLDNFGLLLALQGQAMEKRGVKEVEEEVFLGELVDVGVGDGEGEFAYDFFGLVAEDVDGVSDLRPYKYHSSTQHQQISGQAYLAIPYLLDFSIGTADSLDQAVHSDAIEAVFRHQFHQYILIFDGDILFKSSFRTEFPSYSVLIRDYKDKMRLFLNRLAVNLAVNYKLISRHLVFDQQFSAINVVSELPHFKAIAVIDYHQFPFAVDPVAAAVANLMLVLAIQLSCLQMVEAEVRRQASTDQIPSQSLQGKDIVTLPSNMLPQFPFLIDQPHHAHFGIRACKIDTHRLFIYLNGQDWPLMLTEGLHM